MRTLKLISILVISALCLGLWSPTIVAKEKRCQFDIVVNGVRFGYDLSALLPFRGKCNPFFSGSLHLATHAKIIEPFFTTTDGPLSLFYDVPGPVVFTASIRLLRNPSLTLDDLPKHAGTGEDAEHMFFPDDKPSSIQFKTINSRRWLMTTKFEDREKRIPRSRIFSTLERGMHVTFSTVFRSAASTNPEWRYERLDLLEQLVRRFSISPPE
jgi:hypothetical protein